ncbi:hypothetical protein Ciccas_008611, partial [Cichlidogyrus casuarinus]
DGSKRLVDPNELAENLHPSRNSSKSVEILRRLRPNSSSNANLSSLTTKPCAGNMRQSLNLLNRLSLREPFSGPVHQSSSALLAEDHKLEQVIRPQAQERAAIPAIPSTQRSNIGATFSLIFEGCPVKINATASWTNPLTNTQVIILGTNDGIYFLQLKSPGQPASDCAMQLLFPRRCLYLAVVHDTMVSLSGQYPQLYTHNLITLMKMSVSSQCGTQVSPSNPLSTRKKLARKLSKLLPKRFMPSTKIAMTKYCRRVAMARNPFNGAKYLCAAMENEILVMEWFNPVGNFIEIKRVHVSEMPKPLLVFNLIIQREQALPLACLGVYKHHSSRGRDGKRYRMFLVDLNKSKHLPSQVAVVSSSVSATLMHEPTAFSISAEQALHFDANSNVEYRNSAQVEESTDETKNTVFLPDDSLPVVDVVQLEHNAILVCFQDCAKVLNLTGQLKTNKHRASNLDFNSLTIESIVCLRDSVLAFHIHGLLGKSYLNELTQEIQDEQHIYRLLGHDRSIIVEHRRTDDPMSNSNIYLLSGGHHLAAETNGQSNAALSPTLEEEDQS